MTDNVRLITIDPAKDRLIDVQRDKIHELESVLASINILANAVKFINSSDLRDLIAIHLES